MDENSECSMMKNNTVCHYHPINNAHYTLSCVWKSKWLIVIRGEFCEAILLPSKSESKTSVKVEEEVLSSPLPLLTTCLDDATLIGKQFKLLRSYICELTNCASVLIGGQWIILSNYSDHCICQIYNILTNTWSLITTPTTFAYQKFYSISKYSDEEMIVFLNSGEIYLYNVLTQAWTLFSVTVPNVELNVVLSSSHVYCIKKDSGIPYEEHCIYELSTSEWIPLWRDEDRTTTQVEYVNDLLLVWKETGIQIMPIEKILSTWSENKKNKTKNIEAVKVFWPQKLQLPHQRRSASFAVNG